LGKGGADLEEVRVAMSSDDPTVRRLRAATASNVRWSREDPHRPDGPLPRARAAFNQRFYVGIPEDLPEAERERRAACARKAYFAGLTLKSVMARKRRAAEAARARNATGDQGGDAA
jgi:hypothetical protein